MAFTHQHYTLGLDYGTNSVRSLIVNTRNGEEVASATFNYPHGRDGIIEDTRKPDLARQHPWDYLQGAEETVTKAIQRAKNKQANFSPNQIIGMGIDTTGSSPMPVDADGRALIEMKAFSNHPGAMVWLWKDHTAAQEAEEITCAARKSCPEFLQHCGGNYSSEWFWAKLLHCIKTYPELIETMHSWIEIADWIPAVFTNKIKNPVRNICAAGHKALYHEKWGGYPDTDFLGNLHPDLVRIRKSLEGSQVQGVDRPAGKLSAEWANRMGLTEGIPVATGALDAHLGAVGCGIQPGSMVKIMGTSTCDIIVTPMERELPYIPGLCGIVPASVLPAHHGLEAGQSAVGDLFHWWVQTILKGSEHTHESLTTQAQQLQPGESGLLALDWNNGNRCLLCDPLLSGLILGQTLQTQPYEIYRTLIEATAFGARMILERLQSHGIVVSKIIACGGLAEKNPMLMQIYADVTGRDIRVAKSSQTCALGAAVAASVAAGVHTDMNHAQARMTGTLEKGYAPSKRSSVVYDALFELYCQLHDSFSGEGNRSLPLHQIMKKLVKIRQSPGEGIH
jgi:L-ribulokinase